MPDKYGFEHLPNWGNISVRCSEPDCNVEGHLYEWPEDKRIAHFLEHSPLVIGEDSRPVFSGAIRQAICRICGETFEQERKRGRPRVFCYTCKPLESEA